MASYTVFEFFERMTETQDLSLIMKKIANSLVVLVSGLSRLFWVLAPTIWYSLDAIFEVLDELGMFENNLSSLMSQSETIRYLKVIPFKELTLNTDKWININQF